MPQTYQMGTVEVRRFTPDLGAKLSFANVGTLSFQDNYFALHAWPLACAWAVFGFWFHSSSNSFKVGSIGLYGVCDGHGPFGHLVSFRLARC